MNPIDFINSLLPQPQRGLMILVLAWLGADWVVGILAAVKVGVFDASLLPNQLKSIFYRVGGLFASEVVTTSFFGATSGATSGIFTAAALAAIAGSTADLWAKVGILLGNAVNVAGQTVTAAVASQVPNNQLPAPAPVVVPDPPK